MRVTKINKCAFKKLWKDVNIFQDEFMLTPQYKNEQYVEKYCNVANLLQKYPKFEELLAITFGIS